MADGFLCIKCGQWHDKLPLGWGVAEPIYVAKLTPEERVGRVQIDHQAGVAVIDGATFIMGLLQIPIRESERKFTWTLWVQVANHDMDHILASWSHPDRAKMDPTPSILIDYFGDYPECDRLNVWVHHQEPGKRPLLEVLPTEHPLYKEQTEGITDGRIREIAMAMYHPLAARWDGVVTPEMLFGSMNRGEA
ncbi:MAG: DUF2199 domain-containing protein [Proteobacteria bacterium]|nr:DUF2199 domain-containing protein [Pseudomonadota bacterium]